MNNGSCGQYGNVRSRTPRSMPTQSLLGRRDMSFNRSDIPPAEYKSSLQSSLTRATDHVDYNHDQHHTPKRSGWGLTDHPLAMVYSPLQGFENLYDEEAALMHGTMFADLYLPFEGNRCGKDRC